MGWKCAAMNSYCLVYLLIINSNCVPTHTGALVHTLIKKKRQIMKRFFICCVQLWILYNNHTPGSCIFSLIVSLLWLNLTHLIGLFSWSTQGGSKQINDMANIKSIHHRVGFYLTQKIFVNNSYLKIWSSSNNEYGGSSLLIKNVMAWFPSSVYSYVTKYLNHSCDS